MHGPQMTVGGRRWRISFLDLQVGCGILVCPSTRPITSQHFVYKAVGGVVRYIQRAIWFFEVVS